MITSDDGHDLTGFNWYSRWLMIEWMNEYIKDGWLFWILKNRRLTQRFLKSFGDECFIHSMNGERERGGDHQLTTI